MLEMRMVILWLLLGASMVMTVEFEGQLHEFPDDATSEEVKAVLESLPIAGKASEFVTQFDETVVTSNKLQTPIVFGRGILTPPPKAPEEQRKDIFPEAILTQEPLSNKAIWDDGVALTGNKAIKAVEKREGRELSAKERRIVELEGFVPVPYLDSKGNVTIGVGQTGKFARMPFADSFKVHEKRAKSRIPSWDRLPESLQAELIQAEYRGDLGGSPKFRALFNAGKYEEAAAEFLDNDDYRESLADGRGIDERMEAVAKEVTAYGEQDAKDREAREEELASRFDRRE
jgi:GH24 family phage-related lysozyme (muramidase)